MSLGNNQFLLDNTSLGATNSSAFGYLSADCKLAFSVFVGPPFDPAGRNARRAT